MSSSSSKKRKIKKLSLVQDQKNCSLWIKTKNWKRLEFETKKREKVVSSSRPKKVLRSRLKISRNFRSNKGFSSNIAGNEISQFCEYVYYLPQLRNVISKISLGGYRVESCLSRTWKVSRLELLAPANIRCLSNSLPQKYLTEFQQKLDSHCEKAKVQQKKH